ncbi:plexin-B2 isoform X3 [Pleurodeles waltl]|uniref:plexin-B2 isoform X3 n=1 Tax=Pleurodeles waltl TaxID=8319 RepID=UPI0037095DFE
MDWRLFSCPPPWTTEGMARTRLEHLSNIHVRGEMSSGKRSCETKTTYKRLYLKEMAFWIWALGIVNVFFLVCEAKGEINHFISKTELNRLTLDKDTGIVYVGAVNWLYQLSQDLKEQFEVETGPQKDNKACTPPIDETQCTPVQMDNHNKLLLLDKPNNRVVVCGSLFKGICALRSLENITHVLYYEDGGGEKSFVASNDEKILTVGLVTGSVDSRLLFVGKGNGPFDNGIIVSTRLLYEHDEKDIFETLTDSSVFKPESMSNNYQQFVKVFEDGNHVFFIYSRLDKVTSRNRTLIARLCKNDVDYQSYIEMYLECEGKTNKYNSCQSVYVTNVGEELADIMTKSRQYGSKALTSGDKVIFAVYKEINKNPAQARSALCMFSLQQINEKLEENRNNCYTNEKPLLPDKKPAFYKPYGMDIHCGQAKQDAASQYPCGSEHLPYPLESQDGVIVSPLLSSNGTVYTTVAVAVENGHTVAFLGTSDGAIVKAFLSETPNEYKAIDFDTIAPVRNELVLDSTNDHLYVMIKKKVYRIPVQDCGHFSDCKQCIESKDPYCGWCVVEGKCTRKNQCARADENNHWLWSPGNTCMDITLYSPESMSRKKRERVTMTVSPTIALTNEDKLMCEFGDTIESAQLEEDGRISCSSPVTLEPTKNGEDHILVAISLNFKRENKVFFTSGTYPFYDCEAAMHLSKNLPCISCVRSQWNCQWDSRLHKCEEENQNGNVNQQNMEESCPQFYDPEPAIIPVDFERRITFKGKNLEPYQGEIFILGNDEFKIRGDVEADGETFSFNVPKILYNESETLPLNFYIKVGDNNIDSKLDVSLYNCFYGRSDCSLCSAADPKYQCVWCEHSNGKCVFSDLCQSPATECPSPVITDFEPKTGPVHGGIQLTIKGSNMGVIASDVEEIIVADQACVFNPELYSVSTRIVCELGEVTSPSSGNVTVAVKEKFGTSPSFLLFAYQDPEPAEVSPAEGPMAGGTQLTIKGSYLKTGSEKDVQVHVGGVPCKITVFEDDILCVTGPYYKAEDVQLKLLYGSKSVKVFGSFSYRVNPTIESFMPDKSFVSGGREITITGTGFDQIQSFAAIISLHARREKREAALEGNRNITEKSLKKINDTTLVFFTPRIPETFQNYNVRTLIKMDGHELFLEVNDAPFEYVADPTFENFTDGIKKQVTGIIYAKGKNLNVAMTIKEAKAFVGEEECVINTLTATDLYCVPPEHQPQPRRRQKRDTTTNLPEFIVKFGNREWILGKVEYGQSAVIPLHIIIPLVIIPMVAIIIIAIYFYRRKSQQAEREYEKIKSQLEGLEESVRDRCKKEFTDLMIEMEDQTNDVNEAGIPFLDYKTYTDRVFFLPSKDGEKDVMITGKLDIPEGRRQTVEQALTQFSHLLNSKSFLIHFIHVLETQKDFSARAKVYFASLLTVALHGKLEYYTDIMRTLFLELMEQYVAKNPKLMLRRSENVVERMLANWMTICMYQYLKDTAGEPLYKLFKAIKHQVEKGPVDAVQTKAKYTLNDTGLLGDDVDYTTLTVNVLVQDEGAEAIPVKVLSCDTITQVKEKIIDQVYRNLPYSQRPKADSVALEWRPGSTAQILSDLDLTSLRDGRWKRFNTLKHYNVRDGAILILSKMGISQQQEENHQDFPGEKHALLEEENKFWHLVRSVDEVDDSKSKRGSMKEKERTKAITEIYLTRLLSVKGTLQQFVDNFFQSVLTSSKIVPPAVKYFFDFLDEQAEKHEIKDDDTIHIWKTNSLPLRFWVNILKNPNFIFDVHVHEVVDASLSVIAQTFMDACTRTEHKLSRDSPSNKLLYAKEISTYKKMVEDYYKGIRQMVQVSDQDMNTHLAEISRAHTDSLNTLVALHQLYQYANKYYDQIISALEEDQAAQRMQLAYRLQQIAAALENKVTDL